MINTHNLWVHKVPICRFKAPLCAKISKKLRFSKTRDFRRSRDKGFCEAHSKFEWVNSGRGRLLAKFLNNVESHCAKCSICYFLLRAAYLAQPSTINLISSCLTMLHGGGHSVLTLGDQFCGSFRNSPFHSPSKPLFSGHLTTPWRTIVRSWNFTAIISLPPADRQISLSFMWPLYVKKCTIVLFEIIRFLGIEHSLEPAHWQESSA